MLVALTIHDFVSPPFYTNGRIARRCALPMPLLIFSVCCFMVEKMSLSRSFAKSVVVQSRQRFAMIFLVRRCSKNLWERAMIHKSLYFRRCERSLERVTADPM